jgi:hypothetical protein
MLWLLSQFISNILLLNNFPVLLAMLFGNPNFLCRRYSPKTAMLCTECNVAQQLERRALWFFTALRMLIAAIVSSRPGEVRETIDSTF